MQTTQQAVNFSIIFYSIRSTQSVAGLILLFINKFLDGWSCRNIFGEFYFPSCVLDLFIFVLQHLMFYTFVTFLLLFIKSNENVVS